MLKNNKLFVFQYWGQGLKNMPRFLKIIYNHNLKICEKYNIELILIDDDNVYKYIDRINSMYITIKTTSF